MAGNGMGGNHLNQRTGASHEGAWPVWNWEAFAILNMSIYMGVLTNVLVSGEEAPCLSEFLLAGFGHDFVLGTQDLASRVCIEYWEMPQHVHLRATKTAVGVEVKSSERISNQGGGRTYALGALPRLVNSNMCMNRLPNSTR